MLICNPAGSVKYTGLISVSSGAARGRENSFIFPLIQLHSLEKLPSYAVAMGWAANPSSISLSQPNGS